MELIRNCTFKFECPLKWENLEPISGKIRFCNKCDRKVHLVQTEEEFRKRAARGECIAVEVSLNSPRPQLVIGEPEPVYYKSDS
jgi:hypothetical protein